MKISTRLNPILPAYGVVTYRGIPLYRCQAWALELVDWHGIVPRIISGIRDDDVIAAHNRQFGTNLHGQQWLINAHARDPRHFSPANSPRTTSHCGYADGNRVYGRAGTRIPKIKTGIDALNNETAGRIVRTLNAIHIPAALPYRSGSELHHFSLNPRDPNALVRDLRKRYAKLLVQKKRRRAKR